jgi:hypothetical protein
MVIRSMLIKFNGWQRLWLLFSVLLALLIIVATLSNWPRDSDSAEARAIYAVELGLKAIALKAQTSKNEADEFQARLYLEEGAESIRTKQYGDLSAIELIEKIRPVLQETPFQDELARREREDMSNISVLRIKRIQLGLVIWLTTMITIYALGGAIAWVIKGFRNSK